MNRFYKLWGFFVLFTDPVLLHLVELVPATEEPLSTRKCGCLNFQVPWIRDACWICKSEQEKKHKWKTAIPFLLPSVLCRETTFCQFQVSEKMELDLACLVYSTAGTKRECHCAYEWHCVAPCGAGCRSSWVIMGCVWVGLLNAAAMVLPCVARS